MGKTILTFLFILVLSSCNQNGHESNIQDITISDSLEKQEEKPKSENIAVDTLEVSNGNFIEEKTSIQDDSSRIINLNLFDYLELNLLEISNKKFNSHLANSDTVCQLIDFGFSEERNCDEICETYLKENFSTKRMLLPSDYDSGVLGFSFSPNCDLFIVWSSYDGPDFDDYYNFRAEFYLFKVSKNQGLDGLMPLYKYSTKDWSIDEIIWVNNNEIALKLYEERLWSNENDEAYKYFTTILDKK
jgi:hypothetical protein